MSAQVRQHIRRAGAHAWQLVCNEDDGDLRVQDVQIVVMRLSG